MDLYVVLAEWVKELSGKQHLDMGAVSCRVSNWKKSQEKLILITDRQAYNQSKDSVEKEKGTLCHWKLHISDVVYKFGFIFMIYNHLGSIMSNVWPACAS